MDPFLPGEIPVMVLRYLAANQCTATTMKLIDEIPKLTDYIPAKPANFSEKVYLKHLLRSSANRGLKDVLWDYGNSRILVEDMLEDEMDNDLSSSFRSDSLLSKIEILQKMLQRSSAQSSSSGSNCKQPPQSNNDPKPKPPAVAVNNYTNTGDYECSKCLARRLEVKSTSETGCQTEEYTAVQFGQDDITMIFCKKLLDDNNLQQKISDTINEHMLDPHNKQNKDFLEKVSSKAESEIDNFLVELLQDMPDDCNSNSLPSDVGLLSNGSNVLAGPIGPSSFAEIERILSAMFKDTEIMQPNSSSSGAANETNDGAELADKITLHYTPTADPVQPTCSTKTLVDILVETQSPNSSRSNDIADDVTPESSSDARTRLDSENSTASNKTPKRSRRPPAVKRITPTPLSNAKVNPVFNTSVVVEKKTVDMGEKCAKIAVVTKNIETPQWQKLKRRSIAPKIPAEMQPRIIDNVTVRKLATHEVEVIKLGEDIKGRNGNSNNNGQSDVIFIPDAPSASKTDVSSSVGNKSVTVGLMQKHQPSAHKRKATPVKLTPEKAKNVDYNFMHIYHESSKKTSSVVKSSDAENAEKNFSEDSAIKKTPLPISNASGSRNPTDSGAISNTLGLLTENSQPDVTPMQSIPEEGDYSTSCLKTISPNALQRLIASASKAGNPAAAARFAHKRKSYSTPRRRKHVRSLTFASPPSVKAVTPGDHALGERTASQKRKATEELFSTELRSKKRLNWPASAEKAGCIEKGDLPQKLGRGEKAGFVEKPGFAFTDNAGHAFDEKSRFAGKPSFAFADKAGYGFVEKFRFAENPGFAQKSIRPKNLGIPELPLPTEKPEFAQKSLCPKNLGIPEVPMPTEKPEFAQKSKRPKNLGIPEAPMPTEKPEFAQKSKRSRNLGIPEVPIPTEKPGFAQKYKRPKNLGIPEVPMPSEKSGI